MASKISTLRKLNHLSQSDMAEKMNMSRNGYAKLERGETKINMERLQKIADIFQVDINEIMEKENHGLMWVIGDNNHSNLVQYPDNHTLTAENEKLNLIIQHQKELLNQKEREIALLQSLVNALQHNQNK